MDSPNPVAPPKWWDLPGPVGMKGGDACGSAPRLRGWPRQIQWREFQDVSSRPAGEHEDAQIHAEAILDDNVSVCRERGQLKLGAFGVRVQVTESDSWVVTSAKSDALLAHEQGHFDLQGLDARKLMNDLAALRASSAEELQRLVRERIDRSRTDAQAMSDRYDSESETDHGRNAGRQRLWEAAIREAIESGGAFTPPA
jgi:hypothetical protein